MCPSTKDLICLSHLIDMSHIFLFIFQGQLSLQKFWFYIQPIMRTMEILASVAHCVNKVRCKNVKTNISLVKSDCSYNLAKKLKLTP